jgi:diaminopropionate ammonia-lyase
MQLAARIDEMPFHPHSSAPRGLRDLQTPHGPLDFHRSLPGYAPTPLRPLPRLAARCGAGAVWLKDENGRLGMPAFKILGASWAVCRTLAERLGEPALGGDLAALRQRLAGAPALMAATDGNHGRAVARVAGLLGLPCRIFIPAGAAPARLAAIAGEGAAVVEVDGSYDAAVALAARTAASVGALLVQDTGFAGYEEIPDRVAEGYATLFAEIDEQLARVGEGPPDLCIVQVGVGALAQAAVAHWKGTAGMGKHPRIVGVEPVGAACVLAALRAGTIVTLPGSQHSLMAGLNCGTTSTTAWPWLHGGLDGIVTVEDSRAEDAMRALAAEGVVAGETGAAGAAALLELAAEGELATAAGGARPRIVMLSTEGATDPASWERIVGRRAGDEATA